MKTKNLSKWLILLLCACVVTFYSCDKVDYDQKDSKEMKKQEEKKKQEEEKKKQLTLDPTSLTLKSVVTKNVKIKNGTAPYKVKVANGEIASVKVNDEGKEHFIAITGLKEGTTEIVVTDKNMKTGKVTVTTSNH
ncbi:pilus assembly protein N-terminal domain-containing protein [Prevotella bivia]|uniref:pilus assembly protein N-terminal domain-containing protein n=1 Tax=Prevotella bivia TaxID=28125 RepID=UPI002889895A|nr:pilus assembly protein N-terminal domain-containing protein [Prevotella bivia]MDU5343345.1 pilus assembly protein N-terminal domain-containing protein [Prevotella bivia]